MKTKNLLSLVPLSAALALMVFAGPAGAQSLKFNGVNQSVQIPSSPSVAITTPLTVEAWIYRSVGGVQHSIVEKYGCPVGGGAGVGGYALRVTATDQLLFGVRDDCNNGASVTGGTTIAPGAWTHVAGEWDGANLRVFVNGAQDGVLASGRAPRSGGTALKIGERGNGGTPFNGLIDDVRIWNVARSAADLVANRTSCFAGTEAGLAGLWHMNEGAGLTTADATGHGNTGTLVNGTTWIATNGFVCGAVPPPPPGVPIFDALEIFPVAVPTALLVVPPTFPGAVSDTTPLATNGLVRPLPTNSVAHVVMAGATIVAMSTDAGTGSREFLIDAGAGDLHFVYADVNTAIDPVVVGSIVKVVANRTLAPGPIVVETIRLKTVAGLGFDITAFLLDGIVSQSSAVKWTIGGEPFNIVPATGALPTAIDPLVLPVVPGVTVVAVLFTPAAGAVITTLTPGAAVFDALEIFTPVAPVLAVPAPLRAGAVADTTPMPSPAFMPPGTILDVVFPGAIITRINGSLATGEELIVDAGGGILFRVYTHAGTVFRNPVGVGSIVKIVGSRTLLPGPIVADDIRTRPVAGGGISFLFEYQGVITRADPAIWTVGGVDFNIIPPTGALPTSIALTTPLVLGLTPATVLFTVVPGVVLGPPTVQVEATDALAAEAGPDQAVLKISRVGINFLPLTVNFTLTGTALNGTDYTSVPLSVLMPAGSNSVNVTITPLADNICEPTETVILTLTPTTNYFVGVTNTATATIADAGICPSTLTIVASSPNASKAGPTNGMFTVSRVGPNATILTVPYTIAGTATNGVDYVALSGSVVLPAGSNSANIVVTPIPDALIKPTLTVILTLSAPAGTVLGAPSSATVFITNTNSPPIPPAPPTFALALNGTSQLVRVPSSATTALVNPLTVEAWIKRSVIGVQHSVVEKYDCNGIGGYVLRVTATDKIMFGTRDDCNFGVNVTGATSIPANVWTHVAGSWDGATLRVFVNGVQDGALASNRPPKPGNSALKIGERGNAGVANSFFNGQIDEVRLWGLARTAAQINANKGICVPVNSAGLNGYWKLDEGLGTTAIDSTGRGNTGTLVNAPAYVPATAPLTCP